MPALVLLAASSTVALAAADDDAAKPVARQILILPFDMVDTSLQGEMNHGPLESDVKRLQRTEQIARRAIDHLPEFNVVENSPVADRIDGAQATYRYLYACNGCDVDIGKAAGADLVMTGWVQKVSNLILNINATIRRVDTGREVGGASVDMRNDTDDSWRSSALYLVEHPLLSNYRSRVQAVESGEAEPAEAPKRVPINHYPG
ncbi:DUF3280 domain-containing protein [Salinisphaera aquimarina]|uniref:DUF3280 domain-containing protein n=1 Tax=Salinisphaera aquimarina TaxID=2094031 RepID=A0ABV7ETS2_9GAMM